MKHRGFTLTELLIALAIISGIAALTIPSLMTSINEKIFNNKFENLKTQVQQLATDQLIQYKTKYIADTDFASPETLLNANNFDSSGNICALEKAKTDCWTETYYTIDKNKTDFNIKVIGPSITLKNGALISYNYDDTEKKGEFLVDLNGNDSPNIIGKDVRCFSLNGTGQISSCEVSNADTDDDDDNNNGQ